MAGRRILRQVWRRGARWRDSTSFSTRAIAPACDISIDRGAPFGSRVFELWRGYSSVGTSKQRQCWSCGAAAQAVVFMLCPACKIIQPANRLVNFFDIFDLKKEFELDTGELEKRYKNLQKKLHPDLYSMKSSKEQEYSADQSSQVINAYQVLLKPLSRATYLLETFGVDVEEEGTVTDPEILMEVMEMQETISSCSDSNKLQALKEKSHSRMLDYQKTFAEAMKRSDLDAAKEAVQRMSYFHRIINTIIQKLRKLCATFQCNKKKRSSRTKQMLERILEPVVLLQPLLLLGDQEQEAAIGIARGFRFRFDVA
ncbi:uncharacterized protein LOC9660494 isoform X2 [Selaginella moellendorffii]|uniref:uncharacterized protein LOC9660494 isoform X2 n=1 Tax=Selaginella moellendorffii TaxID=88036 RepID=UPI000D1CCD5F|nr:uncharacterized protein LOC9660494 isoform X2 [Selaginella moellendorffii]|eukprot:XP_024525299.1 uncharacterized protein LOC9660494 isoform X2 [Selaginella moellendorffii]